MPTLNSIQKQVDSLKYKNNDLERRLNRLESKQGISATPAPASYSAKVEPAPKKTTTFESDVGLKWFGKIGITALVIGIAFLIKYAFDNNWINYFGRIALGVVLGTTLTVAGYIVSRKEDYKNWGLTLTGGGLAVNYFSFYAAYFFEDIRIATGVNQIFTVIMLSVVVLIAIILSLKENSQIIIGEAFFLGYVTAMLGSSLGPLSLIYGLILSIGLAIAVTRKKWSIIGLGGNVATYAVFLFWFTSGTQSFWYGVVFLSLFFLTYTFQGWLLNPDDSDKKSFNLNISLILTNSVLFAACMFVLVRAHYPEFDGLVAFLLAGIYILGFWLGKKLYREDHKIPCTYLAPAYIALGIALQIDSKLMTIFWALETLVLFVLSTKFNIKEFRIVGYVVAGVTAFKTIFIDSWTLEKFDILNLLGSTRLISAIVTVACFYIIAYLLKRFNEDRTDEIFHNIFSWVATGISFLLVALELKQYWISIGWSLIALTILTFGFTFKDKQLRLQGIVLFFIAILKVFAFDSQNFEPVYKIISFIVLGIILLATSFAYTKYKDRLKEII